MNYIYNYPLSVNERNKNNEKEEILGHVRGLAHSGINLAEFRG